MAIALSADPALLALGMIHRFLSEESAWAAGMPFEVLEKAVRHSLSFGVYEDSARIGFARVVTDRAPHAYLAGAFVLATQCGRGISRLLVEAVLAHPGLQGLRRFGLVSSTAHSLYAKYGWTPLSKPEIHMERFRPNAYWGTGT